MELIRRWAKRSPRPQPTRTILAVGPSASKRQEEHNIRPLHTTHLTTLLLTLLTLTTLLSACYGPSRVAKRPVHRDLFLPNDAKSTWFSLAMDKTPPGQYRTADLLNFGFRVGYGHRVEYSLAWRGGGLSYTFGRRGGRQLQLAGFTEWGITMSSEPTTILNQNAFFLLTPGVRATLREPLTTNTAAMLTVAAKTDMLLNNGQQSTTARAALAWLWGPWDWLGLALNVAVLHVNAFGGIWDRRTALQPDNVTQRLGWSFVIGGGGHHNNSAVPIAIRLHDKFDILVQPELRWRSLTQRWEQAVLLGLRLRWSTDDVGGTHRRAPQPKKN